MNQNLYGLSCKVDTGWQKMTKINEMNVDTVIIKLQMII